MVISLSQTLLTVHTAVKAVIKEPSVDADGGTKPPTYFWYENAIDKGTKLVLTRSVERETDYRGQASITAKQKLSQHNEAGYDPDLHGSFDRFEEVIVNTEKSDGFEGALFAAPAPAEEILRQLFADKVVDANDIKIAALTWLEKATAQ